MNKNPFYNALLAAVYIVGIVFAIDTVTSITTLQQTILIPMAMLSLFVLSAALMGYLFVFEPTRLYMDGRKEEAINFFIKTLGYFACFTALFVITLLYTSYW